MQIRSAHKGTAAPRGAPRRRIRVFAREDSGATAIEFALLALPFFALLFAVIETALIFIVGLGLDNATRESARLVLTGQAQQQGFDADAFRADICRQVDILLGCGESLRIDVRTVPDFGSTNIATPIVDGELDDEDFDFDGGSGGEIVVVRVFYEWPAMTRLIGDSGSRLANGNHLIASTAAFRNEPFPW